MLVYVADLLLRCADQNLGVQIATPFFTWNLLDFETSKVRKSEDMVKNVGDFSEKFWEKILDQIFI